MLKWQKQGQAAIYGVERSRKKSGKMYARRGSFSLADLQNEYRNILEHNK